MSLKLGVRNVARIHDHAQRVYPDEACGVLLGHDRGDDREIDRVVVVENRSDAARSRRYQISPEHLLAIEKEGRVAGLEVVGFFHSHPDHPAEPSRFDLEHAWPYYSYLIVSVLRGEVAETRAWRLSADRSRFDPERLETPAAESIPEARSSDGEGA
jgi:proteasome lid subunit RPN8/RPN11